MLWLQIYVVVQLSHIFLLIYITLNIHKTFAMKPKFPPKSKNYLETAARFFSDHLSCKITVEEDGIKAGRLAIVRSFRLTELLL